MAQSELSPSAPAGDLALVRQLLAGNEAAFTRVVEQYHGPLLRFARLFVSNGAVAEEVVQDTWLAVLGGLPSFEGRSALKSWIFSILANRAKSRAVREKRTSAFSELAAPGSESEPAVDSDRFTWEGAWSTPPGRWHEETPESLLLHREALGVVEQAMAALPATQRAVVTLRDVEGLGAAEVCNILRDLRDESAGASASGAVEATRGTRAVHGGRLNVLTCKELTELVTDYLEGRQSFLERVRFELHLGMCPHCRAYLRQMKDTIEKLGHVPKEPISTEMRDQLLDHFRAWNR